jgi:5-methyltetrahydrofolate--homocysteine methyltransferase
MVDLAPLKQAVIDGNRNLVVELVKAALEDKIGPQQLLSEHLIPGMLEVGSLMEEGEYFIPEVLRSAKAMNFALEILEPLLATGNIESEGRVILGTVDGDIHDIGKNLVGMLLKGSGFEVQDIGVSMPAEKFVEAVQGTDGTVILGMSALITPVLDEMPKVIQAIEDAGLRDRVKIVVGGAPIDQEFSDSIGADGTAEDAAGAVRLAKSLLA